MHRTSVTTSSRCGRSAPAAGAFHAACGAQRGQWPRLRAAHHSILPASTALTLLVAMVQVPYHDVTERLPIMLVAAAIAYRAMMTRPVPERERAGDPSPAVSPRPAPVPV